MKVLVISSLGSLIVIPKRTECCRQDAMDKVESSITPEVSLNFLLENGFHFALFSPSLRILWVCILQVIDG
jgi:hypothetical protein